MADVTYKIPDYPTYNTEIRKIQDEDPVKASTIVNPVIAQMIENTAAVKIQAETATESLQNQLDSHTIDTSLHVTLDKQSKWDDGAERADEAKKAAEKAQSTADAALAETVASTVQSMLDNHIVDTSLHVTAVKQSKWDLGVEMANEAKRAAEQAQTIADDALARTGGIMTGNLTAAFTDVTTQAVRNSYAGTDDMTSGQTNLETGVLYFVYE